MQTMTFKASETLVFQLEQLAEKLDRSRGYLIRKALEAYLEEMAEDEEDTRVALERLASSNPSENIPLEQIVREYGLED